MTRRVSIESRVNRGDFRAWEADLDPVDLLGDASDQTGGGLEAPNCRRTFAVSEDLIRHPPELTVEDVEPEQVRIALRAEVGTTATATSLPPTPTPRPKSGG